MNYEIKTFDPAERAAEKQAARDEDARQLAAGKVSLDDLRRRNSFFAALPLSEFKIVAIGGKPIRRD